MNDLIAGVSVMCGDMLGLDLELFQLLFVGAVILCRERSQKVEE